MKHIALFAATILLLSAGGLRADLTNHDPNIEDANNDAWAENVGWTTWEYDVGGADKGVAIGLKYLAGYIWTENVGWINLGDGSPDDGCAYANDSATDFGVNILEDGELKGYAWGENIGWVHFFGTDVIAGIDDEHRPRMDRADPYRLKGYAWGENIGWINLDDSTNYVAVQDYNCTCGDYDGDNTVDKDDLTEFKDCFLKCAPDANCTLAELFCSDLNMDGHPGAWDAVDIGLLIGGAIPQGKSPPSCRIPLEASSNCPPW